MQKILLAVDATAPDQKALAFASALCRMAGSQLTVVFLEDIFRDAGRWEDILAEDDEFELVDEPAAGGSRDIVEKSLSAVRAYCTDQHIRFSIYRDLGVPLAELLRESRYADLLIVDPNLAVSGGDGGRLPSWFVRKILHNADCPVMIAPENPDALRDVDEVVFACDGSRSSLFAMKQFSYLFASLGIPRAVVLEISADGKTAHPERHRLNSLLKLHYESVYFESREGSESAELIDALLKRSRSIVVLGAYGRSAVSRFLRESHADPLLRTLTQPIFIAHQ